MKPTSPQQRSAVRQERPILLWAAFALTRLFFIFFEPEESTADHLYFEYALEFERASRTGENFYDLHERLAQAAIDEARRTGRTPPAEETKLIEYPPLAVLAIALPMKVLIAFGMDLSPSPQAAARYALAYRSEMALFDLLAFLCVIRLARRAFPSESVAERRERLWVYVIAGPALCHVLYDRLDLALAALVVLALTLLVGQGRPGASFAALALAIHVKLVPVILIPIWVLAAVRLDAKSWARFFVELLQRAFVMLALVLGIFLLFYAWLGPRTLEFLSYHEARGLQVESTGSSLLMLLGLLGHETRIEHAHRAFDLVSPLSPLLAAAFTWIAIGLALLATAVLARRVLRAREEGGPRAGTFAQAYPAICVALTLLFLLLALAGGKVFSPQYLVWLAPLAPLAPFVRPARQVFLCVFLAACLLTTLLFPYLYWSQLVRITILPGGERVYDSPGNPSLPGVVLLVLRNALVLGMCVAVFVHVLRGTRTAYKVEEGAT